MEEEIVKQGLGLPTSDKNQTVHALRLKSVNIHRLV